MLNETILEQRLSDVERAVAELQRRFAIGPPAADWLKQLTGSITDEAAFLEALALGRALRTADRPPDEAGEGP